LNGQRTKGRKRDERIKFEPEAFQKDLVDNINTYDTLDQAVAYLEGAGNSLDYRRYAEILFDILIAGGMLAPGGELVPSDSISKFCVFEADNTDEAILDYCLAFDRIIRRFKYLQVSLEEELVKVLMFLKTFSPTNCEKLAKFVALLMSRGV
jgi:hypothetical protein